MMTFNARNSGKITSLAKVIMNAKVVDALDTPPKTTDATNASPISQIRNFTDVKKLTTAINRTTPNTAPCKISPVTQNSITAPLATEIIMHVSLVRVQKPQIDAVNVTTPLSATIQV